jgi:hypothetical protein
MTDNRRFGSWLRALSGLLALVAVLTLSACGGGSGAPSNPYVDGKPIQLLTVLPDTAVDVYLGVPTVLSITGGRPPYTAVSSNTSALPVAASVTGSTITLLANAVAAYTSVTVTVLDSDGNTAVSSLVVHPPNALMVLPNTAVDLYAGVPTVLTVSGGTPPYVAASSNSAAVPVATNVVASTISLMPNNVAADTPVTVTVRDAKGTVATAQMVAHPSTLVSGMKVTPSATECGENAICSGQNGTAMVKVLTPNGAPLAGRSIRFDVVSGPFGIVGAGTIARYHAEAIANTPGARLVALYDSNPQRARECE